MVDTMFAGAATAELLRDIRKGNRDAEQRLYDRCLPLLQRWAHGRMPHSARDISDTDDLVQVTLMRALRHLDEFESNGSGSFLAYLRQILLNEVRAELRKHQRRGDRLDIDGIPIGDDGDSIVENLVGKARLDHAPLPHHHDPVRQQTRDGEVVRHDDDGEAEFRNEAADQIEQARLHRNVETRRRLVHEDEARMRDEIASDLQTLAHAARESARRIVDPVGLDLDAGQPIGSRRANAPVMPSADGHEPLADIAAGRDAHAKPLGRVLADEAPVGA